MNAPRIPRVPRMPQAASTSQAQSEGAPASPPSRLLRALAAVAIAFGLLTIFSGGRALFGSPEARAAVGNAVGFVLGFNFLAGFAYVASGLGLWRRRRWGAWLALAIAAGTAIVAAAFAWHVAKGGAYETRTVGALALRLSFWVLAGWVGWRAIVRR
jgi:hypothetical protein